MSLRLGWLATAALLAAGPVAADEPRPFRASLLVGGYLAVTGPASHGGEAVITFSPGGASGRFGLRLSARNYRSSSDGFAAIGVTYEAAASRPRLVIDLYGEAGATDEGTVVTGGGVHTKLFVIGPLAVAGETGAHLFWDGVDSQLALSGSLLLGLAR